MQYKFIEKTNFEDLSSGRVLYNSAGLTNYPVRLACEVFMRCLNSRKEELNHRYNTYGKESHKQAVKSAKNFSH